MNIIVYIISGGDHPSSLDYYKNNVIKSEINIACDSGIEIYKKLNIIPDYLIGDLDSANKESIVWAEKNKVKIIKYETEKDETDTELAFIKVKELNLKKVLISGVTGKRMDHFFSAIYLINKYSFLDIKAIEENLEIGIIKNNIELDAKIGEIWSLIQLGGSVENLSLKGFKYELTNRDLDNTTPIGISNIAIKNKVKITLNKGSLIYFRYLDSVKQL